MICLVDTMATIAELTGLPLPKSGVGGEDSISFLPALLRKTMPESGRKSLILQSYAGEYAVRQGRWKWMEGIPAEKRDTAGFQASEQLYDLSKDPAEKQNLIKEYPELAKELKEALNATRDQGHSR